MLLNRAAASLIVAVVLLAGTVTPLPFQAEDVKAELPVLLTSCGQSPGANQLKVVFMKLKYSPEEYTLNALASAEDLQAAKAAGTPFKSVIIVMGASLKGMGAAGISIEDELSRIEGLMAEARTQGMTIIGAHIEGMKRRAQGAAPGDNTDEPSIDTVAPKSDLLIVRKDGNSDGRFSTIAQTGDIPMIEVEKTLELIDKIKVLF